MRQVRPALGIALMLLAAGLRPAMAEGSATPGVPYALVEGSSFETGCFPPCMCPIMVLTPLRGSFNLAPAGVEGSYHTFHVTDVAWELPVSGAQRVSVTGSGTYRVWDGAPALHRLVLELSVADRPSQRFDSGLVPGGGDLAELDIAIAVNGFFCLDSAFQVRAVPRDVTGLGSAAQGFGLRRLAPNPFRGSLQIVLAIPHAAPVDLEVFDLQGRAVRSIARARRLEAGTHAMSWDGRDESGSEAPNGLYFVRLRAGDREHLRTAIRLE